MNHKRWPQIRRGLVSLVAILVVVGATLAVAKWSRFSEDWEHPIGDEALSMMTKMKFIARHFPHIGWNYQWDSGQPSFWIYLPFSFLVGAGLVTFFGLAYPHALILIGVASFVCLAVGVYGIAYCLSKNRLLAILAAFLTLISQGVWYWDSAGYYARTFGMGFYFLACWWGIKLAQKIEKQGSVLPLPKLDYLLTLTFAFLAGYSHALPNYLTIGTLGLIFLVGLTGWRKKFFTSLLVIGVFIGLSAFYFFLMLQASFQYYHQQFFHRVYGPHPWRLFFNLDAVEEYAGAPEVSPLILPLVLVIGGWFALTRQRWEGFGPVEKRLTVLFTVLFLASLYYPLQGSLFLPKLFYIFLLPCDATLFVSVFGAILISIFMSRLLRSWPRICHWFLPSLLVALIVFFTGLEAFFPFEDRWLRRLTTNRSDGEEFIARLVIDPEEKQFRLGTNSPGWAEIINYFYDVPQNCDYFFQGVVYNDWQYWQQSAVWDERVGVAETRFLIDWYAIKWLLSTDLPGDSSLAKFSSMPEDYRLVYSESPHWYEFETDLASPILSATNRPSVLVIGDQQGYDLFVRGLALAGLDSQQVIPVRGEESLDSYQAEDLSSFSVIYLYRYKYRDWLKVSELLKNYVSSGGSLVVEGTSSPEFFGEGTTSLFPPLPETAVSETEISDDWVFEVEDHELTRGIDFKLFDPPVYDEVYPWKVAVVENSDNFSPILTSAGKPLVLTREEGGGRVVWMGLNLNYHLTASKNQVEADFFKKILEWASRGEMAADPGVDYRADFVHPERREVWVESPAKGILNKEYYFPVWRAYLEKDGQRQRLNLYRGGLDQQYVPLPAEVTLPYKVVLVYGRWPVEYLGFAVSGVTILVLLAYIFEGILYPPFLRKRLYDKMAKIRSATANWWRADE